MSAETINFSMQFCHREILVRIHLRIQITSNVEIKYGNYHTSKRAENVLHFIFTRLSRNKSYNNLVKLRMEVSSGYLYE